MEGGGTEIDKNQEIAKEKLLGNKRLRKERAKDQKDKNIREEIEESKSLYNIRIDWNT
jgi:hypothetical protein